MVFVGLTIEGALNETEKVGTEERPEWKQKYTLAELLDPDFRLPADDAPVNDGLEDLLDSGRIHGLKFDEVG